jgi:hypothetical protein
LEERLGRLCALDGRQRRVNVGQRRSHFSIHLCVLGSDTRVIALGPYVVGIDSRAHLEIDGIAAAAYRLKRCGRSGRWQWVGQQIRSNLHDYSVNRKNAILDANTDRVWKATTQFLKRWCLRNLFHHRRRGEHDDFAGLRRMSASETHFDACHFYPSDQVRGKKSTEYRQ